MTNTAGSILRSLLATAAITAATLAAPAVAQEKQRFSIQVPPESTKYVQQHVIDVDDSPKHQVRIFEIRRTYPKGAAMFDGVGIVEDWARGYSDYIDGSGHNWGYETYLLENGDKVFARWEATSHRRATGEGPAMGSGIAVTTLLGGTGRFARIRGTLFGSYSFDPSRGINTTKTEGEYWIEP
jgi:hypothetical protein